MVKTNRSTLHTVYNIQQSATQSSNDTTDRLSRRTSGVASYGALGHVPPRLPTISFLVHFGVNLTTKYCVVCDISWCRCQQLTALSISTVLVTKLSRSLLHPA